MYSSARSARNGWSGSGSLTKATSAWITKIKIIRVGSRSGDQTEVIDFIPTLIRLCRRLPVLRTDDGKTHLTLLIDVGMVNAGLKADLGRLEWILCRKSDFYFEGSLVVRWILLQMKRHVHGMINQCCYRK